MFSQAVDLYDGILKRCGVALPEEVKECSVMDSIDLNLQLDKVIKMVIYFLNIQCQKYRANMLNGLLSLVTFQHDDLLIGNKYNRSDLDVVPPDSSPYVFDAPLRNSTASSFVNRKRIQIDLDFDKFAKMTNHSKLELDMAASPFLFERLCGGFQVQVVINNMVFISIRCFLDVLYFQNILCLETRNQLFSLPLHLFAYHSSVLLDRTTEG